MFKRFRKTKVLALVLVALAIAAGVAYAAGWLTSSQGKGRGKGASLSALTIAQPSAADLSSTSGDLMPGGSGSVYVLVTNPNPVAVYANTVTAAASPIAMPDDTTACPTSNIGFASGFTSGITYTNADNPSGALKVPANASGFLLKLPRLLTMDANAPDGCQGIGIQVQSSTGSPAGPGFTVTFSTVAPA